MARKPRIEYAGAMYHAMARGDHGERIFFDDDDRGAFLDTLGRAVERTGWRVHAYVMMSNHFHLLLETPEPNLVAGMKWFQGTYTQRFNARHRLRGHVYQGRYKAVIVEPEENRFLDTVATYIHLNPLRAGMIRAGARLKSYPWSSFPALLSHPRQRPSWLQASAVFDGAGVHDDAEGRREYEAYIEQKARAWRTKDGKAGLDEEWSPLRRGWFLGYREFRDRLVDELDKHLANRPAAALSGAERKEHGERRASELLEAGLRLFGADPKILEASPNGSAEKRVLAWFIKKHTTASLRWLSEALHMGHISNISAMIGEVERDADGKYGLLKKRVSGGLK